MNDLSRIVYIANARMPTEKAHGIQIAKMCEAFVEQGVSVELVVPSRGSDRRTLREFYDLRVDVPMTRLWIPDWYGGRIGFVLGSFIFAVRYFLHLRARKLRGESFVIYTTDIDQFSFFLIPFLGAPYAVEMHDAKRTRWQFRLLFSRARCVIAVNAIIKEELAAVFGIPQEKIAVWPNGYDAHFFAAPEEKDTARTALGLLPDKKIALYAGRAYSWKGLETIVAAARLLPDVLFYFVGGTADELSAMGAMRDQPANFICAGQKHIREIPRWLWAADVLLVSGTAKDAYSYRHTSPMKLFEYIASGRPIVASQTPAIGAAVSGEEVFFCRPDNAADMAERIRWVCTHPLEAREKAARAAARAASWDSRAAGIGRFISRRL